MKQKMNLLVALLSLVVSLVFTPGTVAQSDSSAARKDAAVVGTPCGVDARMLRYPDVSVTQITFVYAGDIWVAPKTGGAAMRLSSPRGEESFPRTSTVSILTKKS